MFKIIGADGNEYGPVTADQLRQWIVEGRANAQSKIALEGSTDWKPLSDFPEFAAALGRTAPPMPEPPRVNHVNAENLATEVIARDFHVEGGKYIGQGWELVKNRFWLAVGVSALIILISSALNSVPILGYATSLAFNYVFFGGLDWFFLKLIRGERADVGDAFAGFTLAFVPLLLFSLVSQLLTAVGLILCILPGIYLAVCWFGFAPLLIIDKRFDFWPAMEASRKIVSKHWWQFFGFMLLQFLVVLLGVLACGIGIFVAIPVAIAARVYFYQEIICAAPSSALPSTSSSIAPQV